MTRTNQTDTIKIVPRCLTEGEKHKRLTYSATGYILPCSYADDYNIADFQDLIKDHLSIYNIDNVQEQILNSKEWKDFYKVLKEDPENAPKSCKFYCGSNWLPKKRQYIK